MEILQKLGIGSQPVIGLAKRLEEVFLPRENRTRAYRENLGPASGSSSRSATRRTDLRSPTTGPCGRSGTLQTELDLIDGVGKKRAKELLEAFGSVQGVKFATGEQLEEVVGAKTASKIREYFTTGECARACSRDRSTILVSPVPREKSLDYLTPEMYVLVSPVVNRLSPGRGGSHCRQRTVMARKISACIIISGFRVVQKRVSSFTWDPETLELRGEHA